MLLNNFFPIVDTCLSCKDMARQTLFSHAQIAIYGESLGPVFSARSVQHVSDLHLKFALRPHHVWKYGRHMRRMRLGEEKKEEEEEQTRIWANAQRNGRPAEYRWRPLFNTAVG